VKKIVLATALLALGSASAFAADLPARTYTKAPMMAPVNTWQGFYIGGNVGYSWGKNTTDFTFLPTSTLFAANNATFDSKPEGVIGGAQVGYNWQTGSLVAGIEADIQGSGIKGSIPKSLLVNSVSGLPLANTFRSSDEKLSWFGTVRGRIGVAVMPTLLLYGTGGLAYGNVSASATTHFTGPFDFPASVSQTKVGWTAGAGAEWLFANNWSAKLEYLYVDLGKVSAIGTTVTLPPTIAVGYDWKTQDHIVRAGVNYHF
jgi:outer membrane immunogenic protein